MNIGIFQDEQDHRNYLAEISDLVSARFEKEKTANPRGYMDRADISCEDWVIEAAAKLGGSQIAPPDGCNQSMAFSFVKGVKPRIPRNNLPFTGLLAKNVEAAPPPVGP